MSLYASFPTLFFLPLYISYSTGEIDEASRVLSFFSRSKIFQTRIYYLTFRTAREMQLSLDLKRFYWVHAQVLVLPFAILFYLYIITRVLYKLMFEIFPLISYDFLELRREKMTFRLSATFRKCCPTKERCIDLNKR